MTTSQRVLFVTGKLAEPALRRTVNEFSRKLNLQPEFSVLNISVAALMTPAWVARHLEIPHEIHRVILPGWCQGDLSEFSLEPHQTIECGPKDLRDLAEFFGQQRSTDSTYGDHDIDIIAEINHCPKLSLDAILAGAISLHENGADIIDLGCDPGTEWTHIHEAVTLLCSHNIRVSVDSFNPHEVTQAVKAGAELILSVNSSNIDLALDLGCRSVVIPDVIGTLDGFDSLIGKLNARQIPFILDPVLEPFGGLSASIQRYAETRRRWPECEMMMGIGNLTELTDVDSAGINVLLTMICQELGIRSVLTTEVINWASSSVKELDLARRLTYYSQKHNTLPKHVEPRLVALRDPKRNHHTSEELNEIATRIRDPNFRIFATNDKLHVMNNSGHYSDTNPFRLMSEIFAHNEIQPEHAFYLGYEMAKALTAVILSKQYNQDQPLSWGFLTKPEPMGRVEKSRNAD